MADSDLQFNLQNIRRWYLLVTLIVLQNPAWADTGSLAEKLAKPSLSRDDLTNIFVQAEDHPKLFLEQLATLWNETSADDSSLLKARTGWMIGRFSNYEELPGFKVRLALNQTLELIEKHRLSVSANDLRYFIAYAQEPAEDPDQEQRHDQTLLALAEKIEDADTRAFAYSQLLFDFVNAGTNSQRVPILIEEVIRLLPVDHQPVSPIHIATLSDLSAILAIIGQEAQAETLDQGLDAACIDLKMRCFCAIRAYNRGILLLKQDIPAKNQEAIRLFEKSQQLSLQTEDWVMVAKNQYGLSRAYNQVGQYTWAAENGQKAAAFLEQKFMEDWAALALAQVARAYLGLNRPAAALAVAEKALKLCPPSIDSIVTEIHLHLARSHEALNQSSQALKHLKLYMEGERKIRTDDAHKRYMKLRDLSLSKQNALQAEQIGLLKKFKFVSFLAAGLALILALAMILSYRQSIIIRLSRQRMKNVLDNIDEGIAILDGELKIQHGYSPFLHNLLGDNRSSLDQIPLLELLQGGSGSWMHDKVVAQEALLACMGESMLSWEFNRDHLPHEVQLKDRILSLHWQPLLNDQKLIASYLVAIRDITNIKAMQRQAQKQIHNVQLLQSKLEEILQGKLPDIRSLILMIGQQQSFMLEDIMQKSQNQLMLRQLHTWKGLARTLGLKSLATSIHELEGCLSRGEAQSDRLTAWGHFEKSLADYEYILNTLLVTTERQSSHALTLYDYGSLYAADISKRLSEHGCLIEALLINDQVQSWDQEELPRIHHILLHVLANAVDHGFIRPKQTQTSLQAARILIDARIAHETVELVITDNGAGINWSKVLSKAQAMGLKVEEGADLSHLLFLDGMSTAESTSETSGRGVGLSAVKSLCQELSGHITIGDSLEGGVRVLIVLPTSIVLHQLPDSRQTPAA